MISKPASTAALVAFVASSLFAAWLPAALPGCGSSPAQPDAGPLRDTGPVHDTGLGVDTGKQPDGAGPGEKLRFVFLADSRADSYGDPPAAKSMINAPVLGAIAAEIAKLSPLPSFVVFGGDMAYRGRYRHSSTSTDFFTFDGWKEVMSPVSKASIPIYAVIGNHELYDTHGGKFWLANQTAFQAAFTDNPLNGPPGYERLAFSFSSPGGSAFFAALDPYYLTADANDPSLVGNIDDTQMKWLAAQVAQTKATHKFLFVHAPYYYMSATPANASYTMLWSLLDINAFDIYLCGHSHLYSRRAIDGTIPPNPQTDPQVGPWKNNVVQLLNGTCGAPIESDGVKVDRALWHVSDAADKYYFSVVDIDGPQVTVTSYWGNTGAYEAFDTFTVR